MYGGRGRRLLRRPHRRQRQFTIVAAGILIFLIFFFLIPSSLPANTTAEADQRLRRTLKPQGPLPGQGEAINPPVNGDERTQHEDGERGKDEQGVVVVGGSNGGIQNEATYVEARADGLRKQYAEELYNLEALDVFTPRPGEERVSFERFASCLGNMLAVDAVDGTEVPRTDPASTKELPLLISVTAGNTQDLKAMICNLTTPYKYIVLAQTGDTPEMTPFFELLTRVFSFTKRLVVLQFKESIGFAGAVNAGLREALRHPFDEVPFVHIVHNDVRYLHNALADSIENTYADVRNDKEVVARLEAEVMSEPNAYTPLIRQEHVLRAPITANSTLPQLSGKSSVLVTSALLPDRVRYMAEEERKTQFAGHFSFSFHSAKGEYTAVYLSRLAVLTVGFFDENFYPIMFDDTDYRWRAAMLGFSELHYVKFDGALVAFDLDCTNTKVDSDDGPLLPLKMLSAARRQTTGPGNGKPQLSPATKVLLRECASAFARGVQFNYMAAKWSVIDFMELKQATTDHQPFALEVFSGKAHLPLDAWVVDTHRIAEVKKSLRDTGTGGHDIAPYNPEVILEALN